MRILLGIAHYFRGEDNPKHSSVDSARRDERTEVIQKVIRAWRGHLGPTTQHTFASWRLEPRLPLADSLDIAVFVSGDHHLLQDDFCTDNAVEKIDAQIENPRMLGFSVQKYFADHRHEYDMFIYSEDDLLITNANIPSNIMGFQEVFGYRRLLMPVRYEWNLNGRTLKTFIDGDIPRDWVKRYEDKLPDWEFLRHHLPGRTIVCARAANPHSGFFALTAEQLCHWVSRPHFGDQDCSFVGPLESAATLGMMKTFSIYKPCGRDTGWLEIQHLDNRFSNR